jgi:hypothetical protein
LRTDPAEPHAPGFFLKLPLTGENIHRLAVMFAVYLGSAGVPC